MSEDASEKPGIVVIDPDPASRNAVEDLEDDLGRPVLAVDSVDFDPDGSDEIRQAGAFIVAWDCGIRSGADWVEWIRGDQRLADRPVIVAAGRVSRELVQTALAIGADAVCAQPYVAEEIEARLAHAERARAPAA